MNADYPGNRFLLASWTPGAAPRLISQLRAATKGWSLAEGPGWLLACERPAAWAAEGTISLAAGRSREFDRAAACIVGAREIARAVSRGGGTSLLDMAAPFRAAWADTGSRALYAFTDAFGLGQVFLTTAPGFAAAASTATLLAQVTASPLSLEALAGFAQFGGLIGEETPFTGVTKLPAGEQAELHDGRLATRRIARELRAEMRVTEAFTEAVGAMLKAAPESELELSGGLDSRLILAAMPSAARKGRRAITIGVNGESSDDVTIARALAATEGLDWTALDAGGVSDLDAPALRQLLSYAAAGYDCMANPLDKVALILSGRGRSVQTRFGGQNGEILRGFYYVGQPLDAAPTAALARRLISWRLTANDKVDSAILSPALREDLRVAAETRMTSLLLRFDGNWGQVLDQFYLAQRMQNWVGNACGSRVVEYLPLFPFFDQAFVAAAMARPPADKLNSRAAYEMLCELDPALSERPLADGFTPAMHLQTGLMRQISDVRVDATRAIKRLRRKIAGVARPTLGSQTVSQCWHRLELYKQLPWHRLAATGLFDSTALDRVANGQWLPDRATLGFLLLTAELETRA